MFTEKDIKGDLRDLVYFLEEAYTLLKEAELSSEKKIRILDNLKEKQVIITKMIKFFNT